MRAVRASRLFRGCSRYDTMPQCRDTQRVQMCLRARVPAAPLSTPQTASTRQRPLPHAEYHRTRHRYPCRPIYRHYLIPVADPHAHHRRRFALREIHFGAVFEAIWELKHNSREHETPVLLYDGGDGCTHCNASSASFSPRADALPRRACSSEAALQLHASRDPVIAGVFRTTAQRGASSAARSLRTFAARTASDTLGAARPPRIRADDSHPATAPVPLRRRLYVRIPAPDARHAAQVNITLGLCPVDLYCNLLPRSTRCTSTSPRARGRTHASSPFVLTWTLCPVSGAPDVATTRPGRRGAGG
ncbi:hypothetical protein HYPSUDRAFT_893673 [Hypholoma sublateritium FD-334 SS-4]|uniref:Uncharacterized protein n=1 Tax=Hypholoma sublateritium (strain FD-334 SS-4) TaxID=945553 RepID=A0A0D2NRQ3_HYPSF|nr:hypothetical protein HYPSUDRAFT_893673 [Hypholoma sublateritium FD-334 SS-4]